VNQPVGTLQRSTGVAVVGARTVFGQVMGLVALTVGCAALGAHIRRNLSDGAGLLFFIGAFACIFGLNVASARGCEQLTIGCCSASVCCLGWPWLQ
jgi:modulator of FtsH protease